MYKSEWPMHLMFDEVWLKVRRVLVHRLEARSYWPSPIDYDEYVKAQKKRGEKLKIELLKDIYDQSEYAFLNSETSFGINNYRVKQRLPYILSFGHNFAAAVHRLISADKTQIAAVQMTGAVFNLGISVLDYLLDSQSDQSKEFVSLLDEETLIQIATDVNALKDFDEKIKRLELSELRLLLRLICWFFTSVFHFYGRYRIESIHCKLLKVLCSAFKAEIDSTRQELHASDLALEISKKKSTLPFVILYLVCRLTPCSVITKHNGKDYDALIENIGEVFWRIDDFMDVLQDLRSGNLNSVLIQNSLCASTEPIHYSDLRYKSLEGLLRANNVEELADGFCQKLNEVYHFLLMDSEITDRSTELRRLLTLAVKDWMR